MENQVDIFFEDSIVAMQMEEQNTLIRLIYTDKYDFENVTDEVYKEYSIIYSKKVEELKPTKLIVDTRKSSYSISPELQEWSVKEISPRTKSLKKIAIVVGDDIFVVTSTQQMMEEEGIVEHYQTQYFNDLSEAEAWVHE